MSIERKRAHLENYLKTCGLGDPLYCDIFIEHNALPEISFDEITTKTNFLGRTVDFPLLINSMTGGPEEALGINRDLAKLASKYGIPMAVGSESIALGDASDETKETFRVAREVMGEKGILIGNISALRPFEEVLEAIELIDADAIQLHLNFFHELTMEEGDRDFRGALDNIGEVVKQSPVPVIIKEVGFGLSQDVVGKLVNRGVEIVDIAGSGGTNFVEIEDLRRGKYDFDEMCSFGNPAAYALISARKAERDVYIIGSGGIRTEMDLVKSLVVGADFTAISGEILSYLLHGSFDMADRYLESLIYKTKLFMCALGKKNIGELKSVKYKVIGQLRDLLYDKDFQENFID